MYAHFGYQRVVTFCDSVFYDNFISRLKNLFGIFVHSLALVE